MTAESLKRILANSEGTQIEYKKSQTGLAHSVYESICAFLNRGGGHIVLGADICPFGFAVIGASNHGSHYTF